MKTKLFFALMLLLVSSIMLTSCSSSSPVPEKCRICGKELEKSDKVTAQTEVGTVTVCKQCYAIGRASGKCL